MHIFSVGKTLFLYLKFYLFFAYLYFFNFIQKLGIYKVPILIIRNEEDEYVEKRLHDFNTIFSSLSNNSNISPAFYDKKLYDETILQTNTELEIQWKKRILLEYTPRGNIKLYYDPFKMGFAYQCDQKTISYELLNACAMKYVKLFQCLNFFMDESYYPTEYKNPLLQIHYGLDKPNNDTNKEEHFVPNVNVGPFIKRKQGKQIQSKTKDEKIETNKMKNKFIYVGKLSNSSFLNISLKQKPMIMFRSPLLDSLENNAAVQNQRISYKDYKFMVSEISST